MSPQHIGANHGRTSRRPAVAFNSALLGSGVALGGPRTHRR
jgi:hypothetical protein